MRANPLFAALFVWSEAALAEPATWSTSGTRLSPSESEREGFAEQLSREGDAFRAVTIYKELLYFAHFEEQRADLELKIARAYLLASKPQLAADYAGRAAARRVSAVTTDRARLFLGVSYTKMGAAPVAEGFLDRIEGEPSKLDASLLRAYTALGLDRDAEARRHAAYAERAHPREANQIVAQAKPGAKPPEKSRVLADALSFVFPGAGQAYTGHWFDAAQAFAFVSAFAFTSVVAYTYDRSHDGPYVLSVVSFSLTGIFHAANIFGADRSVRYANARSRELWLAPVERDVTRAIVR